METSLISSPSPVQKESFPRVRRTYGRPKDVVAATDGDALQASTSMDSSQASEPPATDISSSISLTFPDDDSDDDIFGHRRMLADIDKHFDDDNDVENSSFTTKKPHTSNSMFSSSIFKDNTPNETDRRSTNFLSRPSPDNASSPQPSPTLSPLISTRTNGVRKGRVVDSGESDNDVERNDKGTSPASPQVLHVFDTPKSRSSPTPPTSDMEIEEMAVKGKGIKRPSFTKRPYEEDDASGSNQVKNGKKRKSKGLSRKELKETRLNQAKLIYNQDVVPERKQRKPLSITSLLPKLEAGFSSNASKATSTETRPATSKKVKRAASSDPIQDFTSSSPNHVSWDNPVLLKPIILPTSKLQTEPMAALSDDDEMPPDLSTVFKEHQDRKQQKEEEERQRRELAALKLRALDVQAKQAVVKGVQSVVDDDDDDLELIEQSPIKASPLKLHRRLIPPGVLSPNMRRRSTGTHLTSQQPLGDMASMERAARPLFGERKSRVSDQALTSKDLKMMIQNQMQKQSAVLIQQKEQEWVKRGGRLKARNETEARTSKSAGSVAAWLQSAKERQNEGMEEEETETEREGDDLEDEDWIPNLAQSDEEVAQQEKGDKMDVESQRSESEAGDEDDENLIPRRRNNTTARKRHHRNDVINSDDSESDENYSRRPLGRILVPDTSFIEESSMPLQIVHNGSISSPDEESLDEDDKENSTHLMFDQSEDKENKAVPRHVPFSRPGMRGRQVSGLSEPTDGFRRNLSMSPSSADVGMVHDMGRQSLLASSLGNLGDSFVLHPRPSQRQSPQVTSAVLQSPKFGTLQPALIPLSKGFSDFFSDEENEPIQDENKPPASASRRVLGERTVGTSMRDSTSPENFKPMAIGGISQLFSSAEEPVIVNRMQRGGKVDELSLTLDVQLQPALEITSQVRRKADAIFEKEQIFLIEEANKTRRTEPDLYVAENGMLTQTRPDVSTPLLYRRPPPTQMPGEASQRPIPLQRVPSAQRQPLGTLSFSSELLPSGERSPLTRLRKGSRQGSPIEAGDEVAETEEERSPSPSPQKPNAFSIMLQAAADRERERKRTERRLQKSEFIEGEAQESDDDEMLGFKPLVKADDDEDEDDDGNKEVEGLFDDNAMDNTTLALKKVKEKVLEQEMEDDAKLQKYHEDAVQGKFRHKRRSGGLALDESDSDEDEDAKIRKKLHKKRRVDGDTLEDLATDEKTLAFYYGYQSDLNDEGVMDFAYLNEGDVGETEDAEPEEEDEQRGFKGDAAFKERLLEAARFKDSRQEFNPEDADWAEDEPASDEENLAIKEVALPNRKAPRPRRGQGLADLDANFGERRKPTVDPSYNAQLTSWAKEQSASRTLAAGRGGVSVTGHGAASRKGKAKAVAEDKASNRRKPTKAPSMLAGVSDKQSRFGQ